MRLLPIMVGDDRTSTCYSFSKHGGLAGRDAFPVSAMRRDRLGNDARAYLATVAGEFF